MLEMKITVTAPDVVAALNNLANAIANGTATPAASTAPANTGKPATPVENVAPAAVPTGVPAVNPTQAPGAPLNVNGAQTPAPNNVPVQPAVTPVAPVAAPAYTAPVQPQAAPVAQTVPTGAPAYTLEMIATAGTALIDAGKMDQLLNLLGKYGVEALTALDPSQYGSFANELRALGAQI